MSEQHRAGSLYWSAAVIAIVVLAAWIFYSPTVAAVRWLQFFTSVIIIGVTTYAARKILLERLSAQARKSDELSRLHLATAEALATAIDAKDQTTHCHVRRVQIYAAGMADAFGLCESEVNALKSGALLHDIGKLAVPAHILHKPGKLTSSEFEKMKIHPMVGAQILDRVNFPYPVIPIVRHHHEQWDGGGYPDGLAGEQIPLTARIFSVVDSFDSVREDRPFRRSMTSEEAIALLRRGAGTHFDPYVVEQFIKHLPGFEEQIAVRGLQRQGSRPEWSEPLRMFEVDIAQSRELGCYIAYDQIKTAHSEGFALYEIAQTFGSSLQINATLASLVEKVGQLVPLDTCAVYLYDEAKGFATVAHVMGHHAEIIKSRCIAPGEGVTGFALANRRPARQMDPALDFADCDLPGVKYRSMAALPLFRDDVLIGALSVYSNEIEQYTGDQVRMLETVTRLASDALANAMHHAETESNALTDVLTGLPNPRSMSRRFEQEAARARRTNRPFQVVMLDLDDFKRVNDTYGHKVGDKMLREVSRIIQEQLREYDFLARYAGDEFVAIVQEVENSQVDDLRSRIEAAVSGFSMQVRGDQSARVGISVGTATFDTDGDTLDQLLIVADQAMYRVKSDHKFNHGASTHPQTDTVSKLEKDQLTSVSVN